MPAELQEVLGDVTLLQFVLWVIVGVGAVVGLYKAWPWVRRVVRLVDALGDLAEFMVTVNAKVHVLIEFMERVRHQVENDHDTNLRDEVTQLLDMTSDMSGQLAAVVDWQEKHEVKSDAAYARITALEQKENE